MEFIVDTGKIVEICRQHEVLWCGIFGSFARGEATEESDVDLLVRFAKPKTLLAHIAMENQIADARGRRVDLVTEEALSPYIREHVMRDVKVIYSPNDLSL